MLLMKSLMKMGCSRGRVEGGGGAKPPSPNPHFQGVGLGLCLRGGPPPWGGDPTPICKDVKGKDTLGTVQTRALLHQPGGFHLNPS